MVALEILGQLAQAQGDLAAAQRHFQEGMDFAQAIGQRQSAAGHLANLGQVAQQSGQLDRAGSYFHRSLDLIERQGYRALAGQTLTDLGLLEAERGDLVQARRYFNQAVRIEFELEQVGSLLGTLMHLAELEAGAAEPADYLGDLLVVLFNHPLASVDVRARGRALSSLDLDAAESTLTLTVIVARILKDLHPQPRPLLSPQS